MHIQKTYVLKCIITNTYKNIPTFYVCICTFIHIYTNTYIKHFLNLRDLNSLYYN